MKSYKIIKILITTFVIILMVFLFDIIINILLPDSIKKKIGFTRNYSLRTAEFHHELAPNININEFWGTKKYNVTTNDYGMRILKNKTQNLDIKRVHTGFIGDSFIYGSGINYEEHFINTLQKEFPDLNLLNLGYVSYSPSIYFKRLEYFIKIKKIKFEKIFLFVDPSDIQDEGIFYRENKNGHIVRKWLSDKENYKKLKKYKIKNYLQQNSFLFKLQQILFLSSVTDIGVKCLKNKETINDFSKYLDSERQSYGIDPEIQKKDWVNVGKSQVIKYLNKIKKLSLDENFELVIVYYPSSLEVLKKFNFKKSMHFKLLYNWSKLSKTSFIDTSEDFDKAPRGIKGYKENFIVCDTHWNKKGHNIIAKNISNFIYEKNN
tara:strand:+ start:727 stop:1857 length:1131 start_codon:yes stop_codon:yes gene_type:complete